jgi:CheY-like chemotaxis protein
MEAIGQLTGGLAHDFNDLLTIIGGSLQMMQRRMDRGDTGALQRYVHNATEGVEKASALTSRLLAFGRQQPLTPRVIDTNALVNGMSDLLQRSLGESIKIETVLAGGLWRTRADANQLENAILNVALNARDAMPGGGKLSIETANVELDARYSADNPGVSSGQFVMISVTDTGIGMSPETLNRAFDPFFTTKSPGQGTGLGLSQVYGFAGQSGGHVKIYSEEGNGTSVKLYLPRFYGEAGQVSEYSSDRVGVNSTHKFKTILVVEDNESVRKLSVEFLAELGYRTIEASSALAALPILDSSEDIDLLFTDVVMPDMNGRLLADEARRRRPTLKVLFTTGYTKNAIVDQGVVDQDVLLVTKPFTIQELAGKLDQVFKNSDKSQA